MEIPNLSSLEINVTYRCGMDCTNCNRFTNIVPGDTASDITLERIATLREDSLRLNWKWTRWVLIGGEAVLHPNIREIIIECYRYLTQREGFELVLATRGFGVTDMVAALCKEFPLMQVLDSHKTAPNQPHHIAICDAPVDRRSWQPHRCTGCGVSSCCGIGMDYKGFYPCAVAAAIDRVFNVNRAVPRLDDVTESVMQDKFNAFCPVCGHYKPRGSGDRPMASRTWIDAIRRLSGP